jgi:hypothetical protein
LLHIKQVMFERDFVMRAARHLAAALARVLGLRKLGQEEEAQHALDELYRGLVPFDRELLDMLDPATLAGMLRDPERVRAVCQLLAFEADEAERHGDPGRARRTRRRALALLQHGASASDRDAEELAALLQAQLDQALPDTRDT